MACSHSKCPLASSKVLGSHVSRDRVIKATLPTCFWLQACRPTVMSSTSGQATSIVLSAHRGKHVGGKLGQLSSCWPYSSRSGEVIVMVHEEIPVGSRTKVDCSVDTPTSSTIDPNSSTYQKDHCMKHHMLITSYLKFSNKKLHLD